MLHNILPPRNESILSEAIHYSLFPGGKRFRPILCISAYEMFSHDEDKILNIASSIELFHTFTLIHDDLPCMDDDDYRRGKLTCHKVFGEAIALLAGDALFNLGYEVLINAPIPAETKVRVIQEISPALGVKGVVGGQVDDITKSEVETTIPHLKEVYMKKTASLIIASVRIGGIVSGLDTLKLHSLSVYGKNLGVAFQIMDDVIEARMGEEKEENYATLLGKEKAEEEAKRAIKIAKDSLGIFGERAEFLKAVANWCIKREN